MAIPISSGEQPMQPDSKVNLTLIWAMVAFFGGTLVSAGIGWGRSTTSLDSLSLAVTQLTVKVDTLSAQFNAANVDTRERLKGVEDTVKVLQDEMTEAKNQRNYAPRNK